MLQKKRVHSVSQREPLCIRSSHNGSEMSTCVRRPQQYGCWDSLRRGQPQKTPLRREVDTASRTHLGDVRQWADDTGGLSVEATIIDTKTQLTTLLLEEKHGSSICRGGGANEAHDRAGPLAEL